MYNGAHPYYVVIHDKTQSNYVVNIYPITSYNYNEKFTGCRFKIQDVIKTYTVKDYLIGDALNDDFNGNSILLYLGKDSENSYKYVFINATIQEFTIDDKITKLWALVGNSCVPYQVAIGVKNIYYLGEDAYIPKKAFKSIYQNEEELSSDKYFNATQSLDYIGDWIGDSYELFYEHRHKYSKPLPINIVHINV
jgi:hypothetical protein